MRYMEDLKEMLCDELDKIASKGELTAGSLDTVQKLTHSLKSIETIMAMEDYGDSYEDGRSRRSYEGGNRSYEGGGSNRSYRGSYARRGGNRGGGRSRRMYSGDDIEERITELMEEVDEPKVRQALQKALEHMEG